MNLSRTAHESTDKPDGHENCRLIVFNRTGALVLLEIAEGGCRLPTIAIPRFRRIAQEVTTVLRDSWGMPCVYLFSDLLTETQAPCTVAILEATSGVTSYPAGTKWFSTQGAISQPLIHGVEHEALKVGYQKAAKNDGSGSEPFGYLGWMADLKLWMRPILHLRDTHLKSFEQLNASETFSLVRFDTSRERIWFKAVGEPNLHEYQITLALARLFPAYLPQILASNPKCHGWLMADAGDKTLAEGKDPRHWKIAATTLATFQIQSIHRITDLFVAGCRDLRALQLARMLGPFIETMDMVMSQQVKVTPLPLTHRDLLSLRTSLEVALESMTSIPIPDTLGHSDFNPGNTVVCDEKCVFIDWAEAHVGHPFLTFEYLMSHLQKDYPDLLSIQDDIRAAYAEAWNSIASPEQIAALFRLTPLVAIYAYAVSGTGWRDPERLEDQGQGGYLRSLTRRMKREADLLMEGSVAWRN